MGRWRSFLSLSLPFPVFSLPLAIGSHPPRRAGQLLSAQSSSALCIFNPCLARMVAFRPQTLVAGLKDCHLPLHSRSVFSRIGVVPAHQIKRLLGKLFPLDFPSKFEQSGMFAELSSCLQTSQKHCLCGTFLALSFKRKGTSSCGGPESAL